MPKYADKISNKLPGDEEKGPEESVNDAEIVASKSYQIDELVVKIPGEREELPNDMSDDPSDDQWIPSRSKVLPNLRSSISVVQAVLVPHTFLRFALILFLGGFGLYLVSSWINDVVPGSFEWRNTFVFFLCVVGAACLQTGLLKVGRLSDARSRRDNPQLREALRALRVRPIVRYRIFAKVPWRKHKKEPNNRRKSNKIVRSRNAKAS